MAHAQVCHGGERGGGKKRKSRVGKRRGRNLSRAKPSSSTQRWENGVGNSAVRTGCWALGSLEGELKSKLSTLQMGSPKHGTLQFLAALVFVQVFAERELSRRLCAAYHCGPRPSLHLLFLASLL